jgi:hypothetical protein
LVVVVEALVAVVDLVGVLAEVATLVVEVLEVAGKLRCKLWSILQ